MRNLIQGVKNLRYWWGLIWRDRDYDYTFLLILLRFKIDRMAEFFESDQTLTENAGIKAQRMKTVVTLLDHMIDEHYENLAMDEADELGCLEGVNSKVFNQITQEGNEKQQKCDQLVFKILEKDIKSWWD